MRNKWIIALVSLLITIILLVGCGGNDKISPQKSSVAPTIEPAAFSISNFTIEPSQVEPNENVVASIVVTNNGGSEGDYTAILSVDGEEKAKRIITLSPSESETITFKLSIDQAGAYIIDINGSSGTLTVVALPQADLKIDLSSDFSNPYMGIVFVKLTNIGDAPAKDIQIKIEFLDSNDRIIGIEELPIWDSEGVIIKPGDYEVFEITTLSSQVVSAMKKYHASVKWNSVK